MNDILLVDRPAPGPQAEPTPSTTTRPRSTRYHSLDLWRGVACVAVVIYHATMQVVPIAQPGDSLSARAGYWLVHASGILWVGVPMFFVISGYCIFATLEKSATRGDSPGRYFFRRFRRIFPPYWVALALSVVAIVGLESYAPGLITGGFFTVIHPTSLGASAWLGNLTLTETWRHHLFGSTSSLILPHVWTLCYEEQFYAVAGLILFLAPRRMFVAAIGVSGFVCVALVLSKLLGFSVEGTFLDGRWLLFAAGILVFYAVNRATPARRTLIALMLTTAALVMLATGMVSWEYHLNFNMERFTALAFAAALIWLHPHDAWICRQRWLKPLFVCGTMCYSLYLIHALVAKGLGNALLQGGWTGPWETLLIAVPVSLAVSTALGWLFYLTVERRFLNQ